jgi:hypothetical protein
LRFFLETTRGDPHRDRVMMKPVVLVTAALTAAILLAASLLIATGTRGENARPLGAGPAGEMLRVSPAK